jgi:hypothetical protein
MLRGIPPILLPGNMNLGWGESNKKMASSAFLAFFPLFAELPVLRAAGRLSAFFRAFPRLFAFFFW